MMHWNVGVIGSGRIGRTHIETLQTLNNVTVKTVCDPFLDLSWVKAFNAQATQDPSVIFEDPSIHAVFICSPTPHHASHIQQAADAGKHIFCEKPIASEIESIHECLDILEQSGVKFQVGFNRRFDANSRQMKQVIESGEIGKPCYLRITSRDPELPPLNYLKASGGLFRDMMIHDFDMVRFLMDSEVKQVYAMGAALIEPQLQEYSDIDTAVVTLHFENEAIAVIENSRQALYGYDQRMEVWGEKGSFLTENRKPQDTILSTAEGIHPQRPYYFFKERYASAFQEEVKAFFHYLEHGGSSPAGGGDGLAAAQLAQAAQLSLIEQRPILL